MNVFPVRVGCNDKRILAFGETHCQFVAHLVGFFGGDLMRAVGGTCVMHYREMAYMGIIPVVLHARTIARNMRLCRDDIRAWRPDVVIPVDYPGFNLRIARYVHDTLRRPVCYYISPKIWAWKRGRIHTIRRCVDRMLCILPFETGV